MRSCKRASAAWMLLALSWLLAGCAGPMQPADCYEDEYYDPVDQICYLLCTRDGTCEDEAVGIAGWLEELVFSLWTGMLGEGEPDYLLIAYDVAADDLRNPEPGESYSAQEDAYQADDATHARMWRAFADLVPDAQRHAITRFGVFTDGVDGIVAYVEPDPAEPTEWMLVLDIADAFDRREFYHTLLHEYGHVLTLHDGQVPFDAVAYYTEEDREYQARVAACRTYFTGEGCSTAQSYIYRFYLRFWQELAHEHGLIDPADEDAIYAFYLDNADQFVSDYAATDITEDIAESWTYFVLAPKPTDDTIAAQKVRFFYDFPELVTLREEIRARLPAGVQ